MEVLVFVAILSSICAVEAQYVPVDSNMRSFSSAIKGGMIILSEEKVLYERNTGIPGVITEQWFTGEQGPACRTTVHVVWVLSQTSS